MFFVYAFAIMVWSPLSKLQLSTVVEPLSWVEAVALRLTAHNLWVLTEGETCLCVIQSHRHSHPQLPQSIVWLYESAENATPVGFVESSPICFFVFFFFRQAAICVPAFIPVLNTLLRMPSKCQRSYKRREENVLMKQQ